MRARPRHLSPPNHARQRRVSQTTDRAVEILSDGKDGGGVAASNSTNHGRFCRGAPNVRECFIRSRSAGAGDEECVKSSQSIGAKKSGLGSTRRRQIWPSGRGSYWCCSGVLVVSTPMACRKPWRYMATRDQKRSAMRFPGCEDMTGMSPLGNTAGKI